MKHLYQTAILSAALTLAAAFPATAQVSESGMGKVLPVELYACSFNEGQDAGDLDNVIERWTRYMDERDIENYAAWTLAPYYFGPDQEFDLIWMGAYSDGNVMGSGTHQWLTEGGDIADSFAQVLTCNAHVGLGSAMYKAPPDNETPASSVITMMDCKMNDGTRYEDVKAAELEWAAYMADNGSTAGTWHWFPIFGGGDADFDYKVVNAYENFEHLGRDWEHNANDGGREAGESIFNDVDDCDDARVYLATSRRAAQIR